MSVTVAAEENAVSTATAPRGEAANTTRLLEELELRTRAEADAVLAAAREESTAIRVQAAAQCDALRAEAIARCEGDSAASNATALAEARHVGRGLLIAAQRNAVERVVCEATVAARELVRDGHVLSDVACARLIDLLAYVPDGAVEVRCAPTTVAVLTSAVAHRPLTNVVADPAISAGVRVSFDGGRILVDDTFEAWLESEADALAIEISRALGDGDA